MPTYLDQSLAKLEHFEGSIPWMYRDTTGHVTVGVGLMLPDAAAAAKLPFLAGPTAATEAQIDAEFARVDALPSGRPALFYRSAGSLVLAAEEIASLLRTVLLGFESELRTRLPGYDAMPDGVKLALLDMIYNLGPGGLFNGFPRLIKAIEAGNWAQAAAGCFRHGPGAERNEWTREMFLQSVVPKVQASAESRIKNVGFGLLGLAAAGFNRLRGKH